MKGDNLGNQHSRTLKDGQLTPRQDLVMRFLAQGLRSKEVAAKLNVTHQTIASVVERVCINLDVKTLNQAMAVWAVADYLEANEEPDEHQT
jgi:DNA-binding NarL/FixJ family response regulator